MSSPFPWTRYACPCTETTSTTPTSILAKRASQDVEANPEADGDIFDPHDPRASFSLYPLDHLLFCEECNQIRCPKCWTEEMTYWFCPSCLFEVPSSGVKSDGNRCTRHCYDCPVCAANLAVTAVNRQPNSAHLAPEASHGESYILLCQHCEWTSLEIGVRFSRATKITEQLNKIWKSRTTPTESEETGDSARQGINGALHHDNAFANMHKFYKDQLSETGDQSNGYANSPYGSPANLARIMSLYGGLSYNALKKSREKPQPMREAGGSIEGLSAFTLEDSDEDDAVLGRMRSLGFSSSTTSEQQRLASPPNYDSRFKNELWPVATRLQVRRGKRCACRQILTRPEQKADRLRYKIRLLSSNYIPRLSAKPLNAPTSTQNSMFRLRPDPLEVVRLRPAQAQQYILTIRNPIYEPIKVTLASPTTTPGKIASKVTILCPSFTVGQSGDMGGMWDEALSNASTTRANEGDRRAAMASLTGSSESDRQPEAGKIWERSKNSTSVILEVVPGALTRRPSIVTGIDAEVEDALDEDDDILEVPIYVRVEWEGLARDQESMLARGHGKKMESEKHELAYWCVLGLGRIAGD